jgi:hypothetical protein
MVLSRLFLSVCCCLTGPLFAQNVVVGAGVDPDGGGGVVLEYHTGGSFSEDVSNWPWATAIRFDADSDLWAGAGVHQQFDLSERFFVEASFMPGYYNPEDTDLGGNIHFRSLVGLGLKFRGSSAISITVDHLSNGGLTTSNPGSEFVTVRYTFGY